MIQLAQYRNDASLVILRGEAYYCLSSIVARSIDLPLLLQFCVTSACEATDLIATLQFLGIIA